MARLNSTILHITNHAIQRWNERFYFRAANLIDSFYSAKKLKRKQVVRLKTGDTNGKVIFATGYCIFVCMKCGRQKNTLVIITVIPKDKIQN